MANPWFRMYAEFATDAKVQSMPEAMQRRLMMLFCMRCSDVTVTLSDDELAFALRISDEELAETKALFLRKGFIDDAWDIVNWDKRQFASDSSAERTRAYRERQKQRQEDGETSQKRHGDALDTEADTETETEKKKKTSSAAPKYSPLDDLIAQGVDEQIASDWLAVRKAKKAASTKTAIDAVLAKIADAGLTPDAGLRICCERGWAGFNREWLTNGQARASPGSHESAKDRSRREAAEKLTGRKSNDERSFIDIN